MALTPEVIFRSCGLGCEFAEEIRGTLGDWFWCRHPAAQIRLVRALHDCTLPRLREGALSRPPLPPSGQARDAA